jgi:hypothetical protein
MTELTEHELPETTGAHQPGLSGQVPGGMDAGELVDKLLDNEHTEELFELKIFPRHVRAAMKILFGKSTKLTFIDDRQFRYLMREWELQRLTAIESITRQEYQEDAELILYSVGLEFYLNLCRSKGHRMNERELMSASTYATFSERPMGTGQSENVGFFNNLVKAGKSLVGAGGNRQ